MSEIERAIEVLEYVREWLKDNRAHEDDNQAMTLAIEALKEKQQREDDDRQRCYGYYADCENTGQYGICERCRRFLYRIEISDRHTPRTKPQSGEGG